MLVSCHLHDRLLTSLAALVVHEIVSLQLHKKLKKIEVVDA